MEMTQKEYLAGDGNFCPKCDSKNIVASYAEMDGPSGYQEVICEDCNAEWYDILILTGYEIRD